MTKKSLFAGPRLLYMDNNQSNFSAENRPLSENLPSMLVLNEPQTQPPPATETNTQNNLAQQPAPEVIADTPIMTQNPENLKPITPEDIKKIGAEAIAKSQKIYNNNIARLELLANINLDTITTT
jgi:hypothetical protein